MVAEKFLRGRKNGGDDAPGDVLYGMILLCYFRGYYAQPLFQNGFGALRPGGKFFRGGVDQPQIERSSKASA